MKIIHTRWRIVEEDYEQYIADPKILKVEWYRLKDEYILDRKKVLAYAKRQLGKTYDWPTLLVHVVYIVTLPLQKLLKVKTPWWIGPVGQDSEKHHVCSEFGTNCVNAGTYPFRVFARPWLETAQSILKNRSLRKVYYHPRIGDLGLVRSKGFLAWAIRLFTWSEFNHVIVCTEQ